MIEDGIRRFRLTSGEHEWDWPVPGYYRPNVKNAAGPFSSPGGVVDFVDMVVGSEGIFGMVTACPARQTPPYSRPRGLQQTK